MQLDFIIATSVVATNEIAFGVGTIEGMMFGATIPGPVRRLIDKPVSRLVAATLLTAALDMAEIGWYAARNVIGKGYLNSPDTDAYLIGIIAKSAQGDIGETVGLYFGLTVCRRYLYNWRNKRNGKPD